MVLALCRHRAAPGGRASRASAARAAPRQPTPEPPPLRATARGASRREFGPVIVIEAIDVIGNTATQTELIRRTLPLQPGDVLHASDKRLREARFKVLALGFFRDVTLAMRKGSARGQVDPRGARRRARHRRAQPAVVRHDRTSRRTGSAPTSANATYSASASAIGVGFIFAAHGDVDGGRNQWAAELRAERSVAPRHAVGCERVDHARPRQRGVSRRR